MKTVGVIVARCQPIHNGHVALMQKAVNENDMVLVLLGSANKFDSRNPIPTEYRLQFVEDVIKANGWEDKVVLRPLNDLNATVHNDYEWGFYLYSSIVDIIQQSTFTMYYSDGFETVTTWFPKFITQRFVSLSLMARDSSVDGISATLIRDMILKGDDEHLSKYVPTCVYEMRERLRGYLEAFSRLETN